MSTISDALAAMDKATPWPWVKSKWNLLKWDGYIQQHVKTKNDEFDNDIARICNQGNNDTTSANGDLCAAAPDALAWIKEALPWLESVRAEYRELVRAIKSKNNGDDGALAKEYIDELAALDAMIARAKPEEVGRC